MAPISSHLSNLRRKIASGTTAPQPASSTADLNRGWKTREASTSIFSIAWIGIASLLAKDFLVPTYAITVILSGYILARALFKRNRGIYLTTAYSESIAFYFNFVFLIVVSYRFCHVALPHIAVNLAILQTSFNVARGLTKSLAATAHRTIINP